MTIPTTRPAPIALECRHCTVPVEEGDICTFCRSYTPPPTPGPAELLGSAELLARRAAQDATAALDQLVDDALIFTAADIASAAAHLNTARRLLIRLVDGLAAGR